MLKQTPVQVWTRRDVLGGAWLLLTGIANVALGAPKDDQAPSKAAERLARRVATRRWGRDFREVALMDTPAIREVFAPALAFGVVVYNPMSKIAGPSSFHYAVVLKGRTALIIEDVDSAAVAISKLGRRVESAGQAKRMVDAFAGLLGYRRMTVGHGADGDERNDYSASVEKTEKDWRISCVIEVDRVVQAAYRFSFSVTPAGEFTVLDSKVVCQHNWYM